MYGMRSLGIQTSRSSRLRSNEDLTERLLGPTEALLDSPLQDALEAGLPFLPFLVIYISEGRHVLAGRRSVQEAMDRILPRLVKTGAAMGVGVALLTLELGFLALPATFATRLGIDRVRIQTRTVRTLQERMDALNVMKTT